MSSLAFPYSLLDTPADTDTPYSQRADNDETWEVVRPGVEYTGNIILHRVHRFYPETDPSQRSVSFDFRGCGEVDTPCLMAFFRTVGWGA